jgi:hypothetical protein
LRFPADLNGVMMNYFLAEFQTLAANKILQNPSRLTFSNAMIWNGLMTAIEGDLRISLPILRELVLAINMAPSIAERPEIAKEVCPMLSLTLIAFVVMMFTPDENFPRPVNAIRFMEFYSILGLPAEITLPDVEIRTFDQLPQMRLDRWKLAGLPPKMASKFPYLARYLAT